MEFFPLRKKRGKPLPSNSGIALFMVIAAMTILALLVTEFTYTTQVNQRMAFEGLDQLKAFYLAKSGLKISLLRLKAYQTLKGLGGGGGNPGVPGSPTGGIQIPASVLDKIWSFPLTFPLPTNLPGISQTEKDKIDKFQKDSALDGRFNALIESESSKYNLNMILARFAPATGGQPTPTPSPNPNASPTPRPTPSPSPTPSAGASPAPDTFNAEEARKNLGTYLQDILTSKFEADSDFASEYRDLRLDDIVDNIAAWADFSYESRIFGRDQPVPPKRAPFYSISELHMLPLMDDKLYDLLAPAFSVSTAGGINVNKMGETVLKALIPRITEEELKAFFDYRDSQQEDHLFKTGDDFLTYIKDKVGIFRGDEAEVKRFKEGLTKRNITLITEESVFKVNVQATVNKATKTIEAIVQLTGNSKTSTGAGPSPTPNPSPNPAAPNPAVPDPATSSKPDAGLKITFMRIL